jgi:hypothetical protein
MTDQCPVNLNTPAPKGTGLSDEPQTQNGWKGTEKKVEGRVVGNIAF